MLKRYPLNRDGVFIERFAIESKLWFTLLALHFVTQHFRGMKRDDGSNEIDHSTRVCCDFIDRGVLYLAPIVSLRIVDILLAVALLHDTVENTPITIEEIRQIFGEKIAYNVDLLTKRLKHKNKIVRYYRRVSRSIIAVLVKSVDKENVAGTIIAVSKTPRRLERQAREVRILLPIMKRMRNHHEDYKGILISCRNHLQNSLLGLEKHAKLMRQCEKMKKENENLKQQLEKRKK